MQASAATSSTAAARRFDLGQQGCLFRCLYTIDASAERVIARAGVAQRAQRMPHQRSGTALAVLASQGARKLDFSTTYTPLPYKHDHTRLLAAVWSGWRALRGCPLTTGIKA